MEPQDGFDWDDRKAASNRKKHDVSFDEAQWVFKDEHSLDVYDERHSDVEDRWVILGLSNLGRLLVVAYAEDQDGIRIISARKATKNETRQYFKDA